MTKEDGRVADWDIVFLCMFLGFEWDTGGDVIELSRMFSVEDKTLVRIVRIVCIIR